MKREGAKDVWAWLRTNPGLTELCKRFPEEWRAVQEQIASVAHRSEPNESSTVLRPESLDRAIPEKRRKNAREDILSQYVRSRIAYLAIRNYGLSAVSGVREGRVRFSFLSGFVLNCLFFSREFERKPASLFWFRLIWPFVRQKRLLMPLAESKGIYCFYTKELIAALARRIGERSCLEIAAGDGTLTRFLRDAGVRITATDNGSWRHAVTYPDWVGRLDARDALKRYSPEVVVCSWPPAGNAFERFVFKTRSVQLYIVIASRLKFAAGNWRDYAAQSAFTVEEDSGLGSLVLPPELECAVYVFTRIPARSKSPKTAAEQGFR